MTKSSGAGARRSRRRNGLTEEDAELWLRASENYEPLARVKPRVLAREGEDGGTTAAVPPRSAGPVSAQARSPAPSLKARPQPLASLAPAPAPAPAKAPPLAEFDRRKAKKLAAGREEIDARIDLHGMRQSEAHAALRGFLLSCHANGLRNLLVITGKGGPARHESEPLTFMDTRERGVIKRNVPTWLAEPELRAIVVSYRNAAQAHGGQGAIYVHLRARHKVGGRR